MAPQAFVKQAGVWTEVAGANRPYVKVAGAWQGVSAAYAKVAGTWQQVYQFDVTGPTVAAFTVVGQSTADMRFAWSGGPLVADAGSGVSSVKIQRQYTPFGGSGEGWVDVRTLTAGEWAASSGSFDFTPSTTKRRQQSGSYPYADTVGRYYMGFRVVAVDAAANTTTTAEVKALTKPYGTLHAVPSSQDSYLQTGSWGGLTSHAVRVGDWSSVGGSSGQNWEQGCYFYGSTLAALCDGYTPDSGSIYVQRYQSMGISGTWYLQPHSLASASGAPSFSGTMVGVAISGTDASATATFASDWLSGVAAGTAMKGIGLVKNGSSSGRTFYSWSESFSDSGHIQLVFN